MQFLKDFLHILCVFFCLWVLYLEGGPFFFYREIVAEHAETKN